MNYRIIGADGNPYGPVSGEQLRQWVTEGRANAQTRVQLEGASEWKTLADFPELTGSTTPPPVAPITPVPTLAMPAMASRAADQVSGPAIGLIITGILNIVAAAIRAVVAAAGLGSTMFQGSGDAHMDKMIAGVGGAVNVLLAVLSLLGGAFILFGGIKMKKLESYGLCMAAAITAMVPLLCPCCLLGLPIGIWALVVLSKPEVKGAFR